MTTPALLRPMTIGDMLDAAFRLYRRHFVTFLGIVALLQVPMLVIQVLIQFFINGSAFADIMAYSEEPPVLLPGQNPLELFPIASFVALYASAIGLGLVQYLVVYNLTTGALAKAVSRSYMGQPVSILDSYRLGWRRFFSLVAASLVPYLASFLLLVPIIGCTVALFAAAFSAGDSLSGVGAVFAVLGLFAVTIGLFIALSLLYIRFLLATQAIVLEDKGPLQGLRRSWQLTRGAFWRSLALVILMGILVYLVSGLPASGINFAVTFLSSDLDDILLGSILTAIVSQVGLILALPLQFCVYTLLYYDLRIRREGYDLELKVGDLSVEHQVLSPQS